MTKHKVGLWIVILALTAFSQPAYSSPYVDRLDRILNEYLSHRQTPDVGRLVALDRELNDFVAEMQKNIPEQDVAALWNKKYEQIGVYVGHYSGHFGYSGKLLVEAHKLNPSSPYREQTLLTTITGEGTSHGLGEMPDIKQANQYLKEFPKSRYAPRVHLIIGTFYSDLYKVIRQIQKDPKNGKDYKYECFASFISNEPYDLQAQNARSLGITHLKEALISADYQKGLFIRSELDALVNDEIYSWSWCAD